MPLKYKQYVNSYDSVDRMEYYQRMIFPERISLFSDIWRSEKSIIPNELPVLFRGLRFGSNPEIVSRTMGKPRFALENQGLSSLIYFYKERINNHRILIQLHFRDNEFFYSCYTFRDEGDSERKVIKRLLYEKYNTIGKGFSERQEHLVDQSSNIISIHDNVNFNILYLWGEDKIKNAVSENTYSLRFGKGREKLKEMEDLKSKL